MAKLYEYFSRDWKHCLDFSDESLIELFNSESYGTPCKENNGFLVGKKWLNVNVDMWFEDLNKGLLIKF